MLFGLNRILSKRINKKIVKFGKPHFASAPSFGDQAYIDLHMIKNWSLEFWT